MITHVINFIADVETLEDLKSVHEEISDSMELYEDAVVTREEAEFCSRERAVEFFTKHHYVPQDADLYFDGKTIPKSNDFVILKCPPKITKYELLSYSYE